ncbi:MAG: hypothetical protein ACE5LU_00930 [Anaerolineae bacterium]
MFRRISRLAMAPLFLAALLLAGGAAGSPAYASHEAAYVEDVVHAADIDHITRLIENALSHVDGLSLRDSDIVYDALGRTNVALDLLYTSGATGDVFNTAEHLLRAQLELLEEVEHATLTGNLADLSTVTPLLVGVAQARLAFERQAFSSHNSHLPSTSFHLGSGLLHNRSLLSRRHLSPTHSLSRLHRPTHSLSRLHRPTHSLSRLHHPTRSLSTLRHSTRSLHLPGRTLLGLSRSRLSDHFGHDGLLGHRLSRFRR